MLLIGYSIFFFITFYSKQNMRPNLSTHSQLSHFSLSLSFPFEFGILSSGEIRGSSNSKIGSTIFGFSRTIKGEIYKQQLRIDGLL